MIVATPQAAHAPAPSLPPRMIVTTPQAAPAPPPSMPPRVIVTAPQAAAAPPPAYAPVPADRGRVVRQGAAHAAAEAGDNGPSRR